MITDFVISQLDNGAVLISYGDIAAQKKVTIALANWSVTLKWLAEKTNVDLLSILPHEQVH